MVVKLLLPFYLLLPFCINSSSGYGATNAIIGDPITTIRSSLELESRVFIGDQNETVKHYELFKFDFEKVSTPYIVCLWILIVGVAKIGE